MKQAAPRVRELAAQIKRLNARARERLLHSLWPDRTGQTRNSGIEFPSIVRTPGVCGGSARLVRTRIPIWLLVELRQQGSSEADILRSYPALRSIDLVQAWAFADAHPGEIAKEIQENDDEFDTEK